MLIPHPIRVVRTVAGTGVQVARTVGRLGLEATGHVAAAALHRIAGSAPDTGVAGATPAPAGTPEPVNVVEELDLDPAPVDPTEADTASPDGPVTGIDSQADPDAVDVTPDEVAEQMGHRSGTD